MALTLYDSSYYVWKCSSSNKSVAVFSCGFAHAFNYIFVWEKLTFEHLLLITFILRGCIILSTCLILCLLHFNWINQNWINILRINLIFWSELILKNIIFSNISSNQIISSLGFKCMYFIMNGRTIRF